MQVFLVEMWKMYLYLEKFKEEIRMSLQEVYDYICKGSINPVILTQMLGSPKNIDEILEYVMNTPWNTNPVILAQMAGLSEGGGESTVAIVGKAKVGEATVGEDGVDSGL